MKKFLVYFIIFFFLIFIGYFVQAEIFSLNKKENADQRIIKIAVCPTYHQLVEKTNEQKFEFVQTSSTAESLDLLEKGEVEMILTGRLLKPDEPQHDLLVVGQEGYSFLGQQEKIIFEEDLKNYDIFTDLEPEEIKNKFSVEQVFAVDDVYNFLDQGIVITSWENTDYTRAGMIHLLEKDGRRNILSRRLNLYCPASCQTITTQELALFLK